MVLLWLLVPADSSWPSSKPTIFIMPRPESASSFPVVQMQAPSHPTLAPRPVPLLSPTTNYNPPTTPFPVANKPTSFPSCNIVAPRTEPASSPTYNSPTNSVLKYPTPLYRLPTSSKLYSTPHPTRPTARPSSFPDKELCLIVNANTSLRNNAASLCEACLSVHCRWCVCVSILEFKYLSQQRNDLCSCLVTFLVMSFVSVHLLYLFLLFLLSREGVLL